ncbi:MAG: PAS domain S-box protein [Deltaproteobacteria bacterium]|nr:PAS domain S-box protein [Deltaproteobacteria bacterium]MBW1930875.1 PAS domain S-box protein [Deltaproteobacteria bacterium]MBW2126619.1 PAS domain S-box protein [Deltaproteobacteria bacterium]RLB22098.1 MAG: hypothetical protein DRG76_07535 [Deltaproteobacteria bacterium]
MKKKSRKEDQKQHHQNQAVICQGPEDPKFFSNLFTNSPIGIYIIQNGHFRLVNPEFQRISGYSENELLTMTPRDIVFPDDWDRVRENAVKMLKGQRSSPYVFRVIDKARDIKWIIESVSSICYEGERATLGYFMDTTEHERAKEALRISEEKFNKAFRSSPEWFVITTLDDGFYLDVNDAFLRTTGYKREEVIGRTSKELGIWAKPKEREEMVRILKRDGAVRNMEVTFRMKSGEIRHVLWSAEVIDYGGEKCLLAVTRDITPLKQAEEERVQREKLQVLLETAGATCHELNQPLQFIYYLLDELENQDPDSPIIRDLKKQCDRIKEITRKMDNITTYEATDYVRGSRIIDIHKACKES